MELQPPDALEERAVQPDRSLPGRLRETIEHLADVIGPRNIHHYDALQEAEAYLTRRLLEAGHRPRRDFYRARGRQFANIEAEILGAERPEEIVVVGAHYDTHKRSPGANDNGSGLAALLELARRYHGSATGRTLRFVAFTNEESPFTRRPRMGSRVYARACRRRGETVVAMLSLETLGCYSEEPGSQRLSFGGLLLPPQGDFLALVSNRASRPLLHQVERVLREQAGGLKVQALTVPTHLPPASSSDHWSFLVEGYPAIMLTDTAPLRYDHYHRASDTPDKVSYPWLSQVVEGLDMVVRELTNPSLPLPAPKPRSPLRAPATLALVAAALGGAALLTRAIVKGSR